MENKQTNTVSEKHVFQTEIAQLLNLLTNSLYSDRSIFLRELVSNASDACDKLKYELLIHPGLIKQNGEFEITLSPDDKEKTLTITDNGIGMNKDDLLDDLGTIAHSGSKTFLENITLSGQKDMPLIGQFGVGFYSAFMVADKIEVITQKAGEEKAWKWVSDGKGDFEISEETPFGNGTKIKIYLKKDADEFLSSFTLRDLIHQYSNHILIPIFLQQDGKKEQLNESKALWLQNKADISKEEYRDFYRKLSYAFDEPWDTLHFSAEGRLNYTGLLFIPTKAPFNLFNPERKAHLKLYANRVFISDDIDLLPPYLRFVKGLVDTDELPLNISREILQTSPITAQIKSALTHRILKELQSKSREEFMPFWKTFGPVLKEGLYEDNENREKLADICLFYSKNKEEYISLADYVKEMPKDQKKIYYLTGDKLETLKHHPLLESIGDHDVLLMTEAVDEFWPAFLQKYQDKPLQNLLTAEAKEFTKVTEDGLNESEKKTLLEKLTPLFKEKVCFAERFLKAPVLLSSKGDISLRLGRLMKAAGQENLPPAETILEFNPTHPLVKQMAQETNDERLKMLASVLYNEARLAEGEEITDTTDFIEKLNTLLQK